MRFSRNQTRHFKKGISRWQIGEFCLRCVRQKTACTVGRVWWQNVSRCRLLFASLFAFFVLLCYLLAAFCSLFRFAFCFALLLFSLASFIALRFFVCSPCMPPFLALHPCFASLLCLLEPDEAVVRGGGEELCHLGDNLTVPRVVKPAELFSNKNKAKKCAKARQQRDTRNQDAKDGKATQRDRPRCC